MNEGIRNRYLELNEKLALYRIVKKNENEVEELNPFLEKLSNFRKNINALAEKFILLRKNNIITDNSLTYNQTPIKTTLKQLTGIANKFKEKPQKNTLVKGEQWTKLESSLESFIENTEKNLLAAWKLYCRSRFDGIRPEVLDKEVVKTDKNTVLMGQYQSQFASYEKFLKTIPTDIEVIKNLEKICESLKSIDNQIDYGVPQAVKEFLEAIRQQNSAPLHLLNDEVRQWLKEQNLIDKYVVRRR